MALDPEAGKPAPPGRLPDIPRLVAAYYGGRPDPEDPRQRVAFGTSGHRGTSLAGSFNEAHILAVSRAICEYRRGQGITGPLFVGRDTHALSEPAWITALEVFAAHGVEAVVQAGRGYTPTPVISHAILTWNASRSHRDMAAGGSSGGPPAEAVNDALRESAGGLADGVVITPSHNPPEDGGFKYNPPSGGPAGGETTRWIEARANELLPDSLAKTPRVPIEQAMRRGAIRERDFVTPYISDLETILDMNAISAAKLRIGVDPMGGSGIAFWEPLAEMYKLDLEIVNPRVDPTFSFMTLDKDGKIRMDCSSPYAMASLISLKDRFDVAFGNDPDYDRHGIVTRSAGLMNPNHYLAVCIDYLFRHRSEWGARPAVGKTLVSSAMIDRVAAGLGRRLVEVPVGFKWFVEGLLDGSFGFAGEESAGASFLRQDGAVWTTDKDGFVLDLLAAEITARTGRDPGEHYRGLEERYGRPVYERIDAAATPEQKAALGRLDGDAIQARALAGEAIQGIFTHAPGNGAPVGGLKVVAGNGWFAARPSGTEDVYKIYAESFRDRAHLERIQEEARSIVNAALGQAGKRK